MAPLIDLKTTTLAAVLRKLLFNSFLAFVGGPFVETLAILGCTTQGLSSHLVSQ